MLLLLAAPLRADGPAAETPNWLAEAKSALELGSDNAASLAAKALKAKPLGAAENRQMALTLFWTGHFEDSARYLRRALSSERDALLDQPTLPKLMPAEDARERLTQLAAKVEKDPELCFLAGCILMLDGDRTRALAFLVRAEELAGTDAQASRLVDAKSEDRNQSRGELALKEGDWEDAARAFTFAALDAPTVAENYAGLVVALAAANDDATALQLAANVYARYRLGTLFPWLDKLSPAGRAVADSAKRIENLEGAGVGHHRLASLLYFANGWYMSASEAGVRGLLIEKLDNFIHDIEGWMEDHELRGDPPQPNEPELPGGEPEKPPVKPQDPPVPPTLDDARKNIRRGDYTEAYKVLDNFVREGAEAEVYRLLFVVLVGRGELSNASTAMQTWFLKVGEQERTRLNHLRELFNSRELFDSWRREILVVRDADPNVGLPRLLNCVVEISRGRYNSARTELVVARIESPTNATVIALDRLLELDDYINDKTPDGVPDDPTPKAQLAKADSAFRTGKYEEAKGAYLQAMEADSSLPYLTLGLMRCYFALGDYDNAAQQLKLLFTEQDMAGRQARELSLLLDAGYDDLDAFERHLAALKQECDDRPLSSTPWMLYGVIQLTRNEFTKARDALQVWHDNVPGTRDPIVEKLFEYARKKAS
ncbi:MAG: tetratricopeptide repeat protein [Planctomycetes bacterium]|nr:tetratricopeptide repeat protein [Planctomycetota bacterium]